MLVCAPIKDEFAVISGKRPQLEPPSFASEESIVLGISMGPAFARTAAFGAMDSTLSMRALISMFRAMGAWSNFAVQRGALTYVHRTLIQQRSLQPFAIRLQLGWTRD